MKLHKMFKITFFHYKVKCEHPDSEYVSVFVNFLGWLECVGHSFAYVAHFCIFERCLDSKPRKLTKQAGQLATHLPFCVNTYSQ